VLERKSVGKRKGITSGQRYTFLTNNFSFCAATITAIYKDRWQVDLFFKAIKQNLKIRAFVGSSRNAILTQTCYLP
jgi:putative transposase